MASQSLILLAALAVLFALGAVLIALARFLPAGQKAQSELWSVYRAEFLIVGAILVPAVLAAWVFTLALLVLALRGQIELVRLFGRPAVSVSTTIVLSAGALLVIMPWLGYAHSLHWPLLLGAIAVAIPAYLLAPAGGRAASVLAHSGSLFFPALCCAAAATLRLDEAGLAWIVTVYAAVEVNDSFALLAGKLFGRRRVLPTLSPGKTLEGFAAGLMGGAAIVIALDIVLLGMPPTAAFALVAVVLVAGIAGDLATSALKRHFRAKDFPSVLKRHGGVLDIYDSFLFAAPAALVFQLFWSAGA